MADRPTQGEMLDALRSIAIRQLDTTEQGHRLLELAPRDVIEELLEAIARNQTSVVDMWVDIAITGE